MDQQSAVLDHHIQPSSDRLGRRRKYDPHAAGYSRDPVYLRREHDDAHRRRRLQVLDLGATARHLGCRRHRHAGRQQPDARQPPSTSTMVPSSSIGRRNIGGSAQNNIAIAYGAIIENATGGSGGDKIFGNEVANLLGGNAGNESWTENSAPTHCAVEKETTSTLLAIAKRSTNRATEILEMNPHYDQRRPHRICRGIDRACHRPQQRCGQLHR